jgi:hypothetical protein
MQLRSMLPSFMLWFAVGCGEELASPAASRARQSLAVARSAMNEALHRDLSRDRANLEPVQRADGVRQYHLRSGFRHVSVLTRAGDGGVTHACIDKLSQLEVLESKGEP